ncbi:hypothetical protein [Flocculibacter collagenilyticus]|uniref:hypothetical protein n=1 Tax=Flocculibacter collagenilyticus TaxID=2744479 RepID=UPI0018F75C59|nr:hypothetical protein [Flocculibacter collagenilyticus]
MFLILNKSETPLKLVYQLKEDLRDNPEPMIKAQQLTQDNSKPFGLKGACGLYGSDEWWESIKDGKLPTKHIFGIINKLYVSGQEETSRANTVELLLGDGTSHHESILVNNNDDYQLFRVGRELHLFYVYDELKGESLFDVGHLDILLEVAVAK